jgi:hypothetical protein
MTNIVFARRYLEQHVAKKTIAICILIGMPHSDVERFWVLRVLASGRFSFLQNV